MTNNHLPKDTETDTMNPVIKSEIPKTSEEQTQTATEPEVIKIHKKIHTGDDPFGFSTGTYSFSQSGVLKSHSRIPIEWKPFLCPKCGNIFILRV